MDKDCPFCRIVNHKTATELLFENDTLVVFKDNNPQAPVHLLIVPKKHIRSINDLADEDRKFISDMILTGKEMAKRENISKIGYNLIFNVEKGGGQVIFHLHMHLVGGWKH